MTKRKNKNKTIQPIQNDVGQLSFNFTLVLQKQEQLIKENQDLRTQLENMTGQRDILIKQLSDRDKTIAELIEENKQLKDRIKKLEDKIQKTELERQHKEMVKQLIIAIQDLNARDLLEKQLDKPYDLAMKRIHYERITDCHFINNNSDDTIIYAKKYVLRELLENAPIEVKSKINNLARQQDFVEQIILYLKNTINSIPLKDDYDYAREWFDCI